jgi:uncharacterized protein (TIGR03437 family)
MRILGTMVVLAAGLTWAQPQSGPALAVDASASRHSISPDIYGINWYWDGEDPTSSSYDPQQAAQAPDMGATVRRWGGNNTSTYHWRFDVDNIDADWFFEVLPLSAGTFGDGTVYDVSKLPDGSTFNLLFERTRATGAKLVGTVPVLGWLPKARQEMCSFEVAKYGRQCKQDPYAQYHPMTCGDGIVYRPACGDPSVNDGKDQNLANPVYVVNDPHDAYAPFDENFQADWIGYLVSRYGKSNQGGVAVWTLDNEPIWWDSTHRDIHPNPYTYDELLSVDLKYARAIKRADPTALVSGPVADNYASIWFSKKDIVAGWNSGGNWWSNPVDRNAHGGTPLMAWYLQQFRNYERQNGVRLLDYYETHAYLAPGSTDAARLVSTREWWDPNYVVQGDYWIRDAGNSGPSAAPQLIPRLKSIINDNYPGTKLAITEYSFNALNTLNGALAQADILGIFGREGVDLATLWGAPKATDPGAFAWKIYRNYDGMGGAFGETGVQATTGNPDQLSIFAAQRSDTALTIMVLNKTTGDLSSTVSIANFAARGAAQVWRYSQANLNAIVRQQDATVGGNTIAATFPAYSMTLFVVPASQAGPKPVVTAVANAASHQNRIAAGEMVVVSGTNLGPAEPDGQIVVASNSVAGTAMDSVRILFDGVPAPLLYVSEQQCLAVVPYAAALKPVVNIQVEYQGMRSDPFQAAVSATAPGLFTLGAHGSGQAAALNAAALTLNSPAAPAAPGSVVVFWGTGEGVTNPPGVDGRLAIDIVPTPVAACAAEIGGVAATVEYCGAAPFNVPGLFQINARINAAVAPGGAVPVRVLLGGTPSQDGVTLVVR